jgi:ABC-type nitrate/sulfonate/bicarbonate transport system substrate-binding protein
MVMKPGLIALLLMILLAFGAGAVTNAAEPKVLNIGWTGGSSWSSLPDRTAGERGFFEKEGLRVRYIQFQGTNLMLSALLAKRFWPMNSIMSPSYLSFQEPQHAACR